MPTGIFSIRVFVVHLFAYFGAWSCERLLLVLPSGTITGNHRLTHESISYVDHTSAVNRRQSHPKHAQHAHAS